MTTPDTTRLPRRDTPEPPRRDPGHDDARRALAGIIAGGVAAELAAPLKQLRENLAVLVETLDRHVGTAQGPTPYPWRSLQVLRQDIADAYLLSRELSRTAEDLAGSVGPHGRALARVDVNERVEAALNLVRHHVRARTEMFVDLGKIPQVYCVSADLVLAIAGMLLVCIESAGRTDGSAVSIKTRTESNIDNDMISVQVTDNGAGAPIPEVTLAFVNQVAAELAGVFEGVSEPGRGCVLELRFAGNRKNIG